MHDDAILSDGMNHVGNTTLCLGFLWYYMFSSHANGVEIDVLKTHSFALSTPLAAAHLCCGRIPDECLKVSLARRDIRAQRGSRVRLRAETICVLHSPHRGVVSPASLPRAPSREWNRWGAAEQRAAAAAATAGRQPSPSPLLCGGPQQTRSKTRQADRAADCSSIGACRCHRLRTRSQPTPAAAAVVAARVVRRQHPCPLRLHSHARRRSLLPPHSLLLPSAAMSTTASISTCQTDSHSSRRSGKVHSERSCRKHTHTELQCRDRKQGRNKRRRRRI